MINIKNANLVRSMSHENSWVEIDRSALIHNLRAFRRLIGPDVKLMPVVKANAYGHGLPEVSSLAAKSGLADWLGVNSLEEGLALRRDGIKLPVLVLGYVPLSGLGRAVRAGLRLTVYNEGTVRSLSRLAGKRPVPLHIKLETGTNRQGVGMEQAVRLARFIKRSDRLKLEGYSTHFANIEDTLDRSFPQGQMQRYQSMVSELDRRGLGAPLAHTACTAAAVVFPQTRRSLVRVGIGIYGLWPSRETMLSSRGLNPWLELRPVLTWKARVAQVKEVPSGSYVSYGCTYRTTRRSRLAVLPVGYYDGYDRRLSNTAHVLIRGRRAPIRGRVCMNLCVADITDIPGVKAEDEVVLLGTQGKERISAEQLASWIGTINYEAVTRINPLLPRLVV
jgi:alanine racemase